MQYARRQHCNQRTTDIQHTFYSRPATWALSIGFKKETADTWTINNKHTHDVTTNQDKDPLMAYPTQPISISEWQRANNENKSPINASRLQMAAKAKRIALRCYCKDLHLARRSALRNNNISGWARCIRPNIRKSHGYAATWYKPEAGKRRRPMNNQGARIGAAQEW